MTNTIVHTDYTQAIEAIKSEFEAIARVNSRSAWGRGVSQYAKELLNDLIEFQGENVLRLVESPKTLERVLLNGARDWDQYSEGGCSLVFDEDIKERLALIPSGWRRSKAGKIFSASGGSWLTVQARALSEAAFWVRRATRPVRLAIETARDEQSRKSSN